MRHFVIAVVASLGLTGATSLGAAADISLTQNSQVTLSCSDGHSVILYVDPTTLTNLTADIDSINLSGTGLSCTLDPAAIDPSMETTEWTVYDYNPSGHALAPRNSPNKMPATTTDSGFSWQFPFKPDIYTALFTTTDPGVTGNLCPGTPWPSGCKTLHDTITVSGDATSFMTQHGGGDCVGNTPAAVRFYFTSPSASGSSIGTPPAGFYTQFWWSDAVNMQLVSASDSKTITESLGNINDWSDWNGKHWYDDPSVYEAFVEATQHVQSIGLSFGGDCFFETGVTPTPDTFTNETFSSTFSVN